MKHTNWSIIKQTINACVIGQVITRQMLLDEVKLNCANNKIYFSESYVDKTRRQLSVTGYLSEGNGFGRYTVKKHIDTNLTTSALYAAYNIRQLASRKQYTL
jgi:hypothetical protein